MGDIIRLRRNSYSGLDADKALVVGAIGDHYYATDTNIIYKWNATRWRGGYEYRERLAAAYDKTLAGFGAGGVWQVNGLNLSAIVPVGAVAVQLKIHVLDDAAGSEFHLRRDAVNIHNAIDMVTHVANIPEYKSEVIAIDSDRLLDYYRTNVVFTNIDVAVLDWFI